MSQPTGDECEIHPHGYMMDGVCLVCRLTEQRDTNLRLCTKIAQLTTRDEQAVLAIARVLQWCDASDVLSKGETMTTAAIRNLIGEEFR